MTDISNIPETPPEATRATPTEAAPAADTRAAETPAARSEPSVADTARLLAEHFPALFGAGVIKPIKLRIHADIHQRAPGVFTKKALSIFLQRHTTGTAYLRALVAEGATRTDLDGQPAGDIAAEHREAAGVELARRRAIVDAKKQAAREAARASRQAERPAPRVNRPAQPGTADGQDADPRLSEPRQAPRPARPPKPHAPQGAGRPGEKSAGAPQRAPQVTANRKPARAAHPQETMKSMKAVSAPALPLTPEQAAEVEARHQRAQLLRSFEQSPLSKANFCALKGLSEAALDTLLTLARQERGSR